MSRAIKYRVWDKENEAFYYWGFDKEGDSEIFIYPPTVSIGMDECKESDQFTGRELENETELYENDIVVLIRDTDVGPVRMTAVTEWCDISGCWLFDVPEYGFSSMITDDKWDEIKLIGNVHQNSDLLP